MSKAATVAYETTLRVRDNCLCLHMQRAARALARRFDEALRPFELTNGQFSLLMSLNRPEPPSMGPVASLLAMGRTTLTAALAIGASRVGKGIKRPIGSANPPPETHRQWTQPACSCASS